jgi:hypothetical protein
MQSEDKKDSCCSSFKKSPLFKGIPLSEWIERLKDLCDEERLSALNAIKHFANYSPNLLPFFELLQMLQDRNEEVRGKAANILLSIPSLCLSYRYPIELGVLEGNLPKDLEQKLIEHLRKNKYYSPSLLSFADLKMTEVITWAIITKALVSAVVSWSAQRILNNLFQDNVNVPEISMISTQEFHRIINAALDESELRQYKAQLSSLMDDFQVYVSNTDRQQIILALILEKSSIVVRGTESLGLSALGAYSIAANLRLLALQDQVHYFGGSIDNLKAQKSQFSNYISGQIPYLQAHLNERFRGSQCPFPEGNLMGGSCATYWSFDGQRQYVRGSGRQCMIIAPPGSVGSRCFPMLSLPPGDCVPDICEQQLGERRQELQIELNQSIATLSEIVDTWKNMPDHP